MSAIFAAIMLFLIWPGRKLGWLLSRFVYPAHTVVAVLLLTIWGAGVAFGIGVLAWNMKPNLIVKLVFGFVEGLYLACPSYGLINETSTLLLSSQEMRRHKLIYRYPQVVFVGVMLVVFRLNNLYPE